MRVVYPEREVPRSADAGGGAARPGLVPDEPSGPEPWHDDRLDPLSVLLLDDDDRVLSALDPLSMDIRHADATTLLAASAPMVTDPRVRGRGHGRTTDDPLPSDTLGKLVLACFFSARAKERQQEFVAATIELCPGEIDRLW